jgi:aerobic C4-dicarboxylate transport protein
MEVAPQAAEGAQGTHEPEPKKRDTLYIQVLVCIVLGAALGALFPAWGVAVKPLGELFVKLVKMLIAPLVFVTVSLGIAGMQDIKRVGRVGFKAILYFEIMTTIALLLGLFVVHLVAPGTGIHAKADALDTTALQKITGPPAAPKGFVDHLLDIVPDSVMGPFAKGEILPVLFLAIITGIAISQLGPKKEPLTRALTVAADLLFKLVSIIMRFAPLGAFGAMAFTVGKYGLSSLGNLAKLMGAFYATSLIFVLVVLGAVCKVLGLSIIRLIVYLKEELLIVLGTSSSESALPRLMAKLEHMGASPQVVRLVVPTGYSFNLDGTCIYLTMAAVFVGQALDVPMSLRDEVSLLLVLLITSKGAAAVSGGGFVTLAATLQTTATIPVGGITLLLGVDRFMSEARALTNMMGNAVATLAVARWEGALDRERAKEVLGLKR